MKINELRNEAKDVAVAIILENEELNTWSIHLLNFNDFQIENVLINSSGSGTNPLGESIKTSQLRHFFEYIPANTTQQIEIITPEVFHLDNQYMVTYFSENKLYDKKFIFKANTIKPENLSFIDDLNAKGIILI